PLLLRFYFTCAITCLTIPPFHHKWNSQPSLRPENRLPNHLTPVPHPFQHALHFPSPLGSTAKISNRITIGALCHGESPLGSVEAKLLAELLLQFPRSRHERCVG